MNVFCIVCHCVSPNSNVLRSGLRNIRYAPFKDNYTILRCYFFNINRRVFVWICVSKRLIVYYRKVPSRKYNFLNGKGNYIFFNFFFYKTCTEILKTISFILFPGTYKNSFLVTFPFFIISSLLNTLGFLKNIISRILNIYIYLPY